jgi:GNAT superfamily N-acetyltransferase
MIPSSPGAAPRIDVRSFVPKTASTDDWHAYHAYVRQRAFDDDPSEPVLPDEVRQRDMLTDWPLFETARRLAFINGEIVGQLTLWSRRPDTADYDLHANRIEVAGGVRKDQRRQGIGTVLLSELHAFMQQHGRDLATMSTWLKDGKAFLSSIGADEKQRAIENRLDFTRVDPAMLRAWENVSDPTLTWEMHMGRVPLDRYADLAAPLTVMLNTQPKGTLDMPPYRIHLDAIGAWYADMDAHGGDHVMVLLKSGDEIVAMSEATWTPEFSDRAYQGLTAVADGWRGRDLAKAVKARLFRAIADLHPSVRLVITHNADVNAAMLAVNRQVGFVVHRETRIYQMDRAALARALQALPAA